ncbi:MAG: hypothetical protein AABW80_04090 [Nanoarchaeota archaeon]
MDWQDYTRFMILLAMPLCLADIHYQTSTINKAYTSFGGKSHEESLAQKVKFVRSQQGYNHKTKGFNVIERNRFLTDDHRPRR